MGAIFQLSGFGIGTDKPDEIDAILEHCLHLLFARPVLPGHPKSKGPFPSRGRQFFGRGPKLVLGKESEAEGRPPKLSDESAGRGNYPQRVPGRAA